MDETTAGTPSSNFHTTLVERDIFPTTHLVCTRPTCAVDLQRNLISNLTSLHGREAELLPLDRLDSGREVLTLVWRRSLMSERFA
ncbi:hypothetical protein AVEN_1412-1 [Araneus ventricosus]|uniref:Uncharacterized protein n=1 Tax=Araneus ventricosus TaxID=182803 RepID=A0A4Y2IE40_ARAVE|nr:hypothetical protein AVEN_1412-1 [Araneus ventricosus]